MGVARWLTVLVVASSTLTVAVAQQRTTELHWSGQHLRAGQFNVHKIEVFSAAESLEVVAQGKKIEYFDAVNVWLRHGAIPTPQQHHVHAMLHPSRGRHGSKPDVGLHVKNPAQGDWYIVMAPSTGVNLETQAMEVTDHQFIQAPGSAEYSVTTTVAGCERGRFGFPKCDSNWMQLSWGKEAQFHGELGAGKDVWTCRLAILGIHKNERACL